MQLTTIAEASGYLGSILGVAMVVPQIVRTYRNRTLPGVSAMSWALTALSCTTWLLYGVRTGEVPQIPGNVLLVGGAIAVVVAVPSKTTVVVRAVGLAGGGAVLVASAFVLPAEVLGGIGFAIGVVSGIPQLMVSLSRRAGVSAVSLLTWGLRVACQSCWLFYALVIGDVMVSISASFLLSSAALVVGAELLRRPSRLPTPTPVLTP